MLNKWCKNCKSAFVPKKDEEYCEQCLSKEIDISKEVKETRKIMSKWSGE